MNEKVEGLRQLGHEVKDLLQQVYSTALLVIAQTHEPTTKAAMEQLLERGREANQRTRTLLEELRPMKIPSLNILVVEDEPATLALFRLGLEAEGHNVIAEAVTGPDMVNQALSNKDIDLIVFDIHLPGMTGFDALDEIAKQRLLPAVVVTGDTDTNMLRKSMEKHVLGHHYKPLEPKDLNAAVQVAWARWGELTHLRTECDTKDQAMERRKTLEKAKGVLQKRHRWDEATAFKYMQRFSMNHRQPLLKVAQTIIDGKPLECLDK